MTDSFDKTQFNELCHKLVEEQLTPEEQSSLEEIVLNSPEARSLYVQYVSHHVAMIQFFDPVFRCDTPSLSSSLLSSSAPLPLSSSLSLTTELSTTELSRSELSTTESSRPLVSNNQSIQTCSIFKWRRWYWSSALLLLLTTFFVMILLILPQADTKRQDQISQEEFMDLGRYWAVNQEAEIQSGSTALHEKDRFGTGELILESGLMRFNYNNGVKLTVEGPARLHFQDSQSCFLYSGNVFAKVSPEGTGYTINTAVAKIKDLGTEFGVRITEGEKTDVHVFSGRVNVTPRGQEDYLPLTTGGWLRFKKDDAEPLRPLEKYGDSEEGTLCTTREGRSQETCLVSGGKVEDLRPDLNSQSQIFTLIKNSLGGDWNRKAYFSIDLTSLPNTFYRKVQLELSFAPTGVGTSAYLPETSEFSVYGLTNESNDFWTADSLLWNNAPANGPEAADVDPCQTVKIDTFTVNGFEEPQKIIIENENLQRFLSTDTNRIVTFIVVRDTPEQKQSGYAHGIANRNHTKLPPPTLRFFE